MHWHYAFNFALFIEENARLDGCEIDGSALVTRASQRTIEVVQKMNLRQYRTELLAQRMLIVTFVLEYLCNLVIGQSRMRVHHRFIKFITGNSTRVGNRHLAHQAQTINLRIK